MRYFLVMWDCMGLETLQDISEFHPDNWDKRQLLGVMMGKAYKKAPIHAQISQMVLRAKFNPQRHYEIYIQQAAAEITAKDFPEADILIVGDHMPPYFDRYHRSQFDPENVPWIYLKYKDPE